MSKGKLEKFAEMETFSNVFQFPYSFFESQSLKDGSRGEESRKGEDATAGDASRRQMPMHEMAGHWRDRYFHNDHPIVLELGCGKGEYTVELARLFPEVNFIGVDIKGARMHKGAKEALEAGLANVAFLRTNIEIIDRFFVEDEVQEIWLTFSDPQMKNPRKRLTSTYFMTRYRRFLVDGGIIHLKTDSRFLFTYTTYMVEKNQLPVLFRTEDLYHDGRIDAETQKILSIQTYYESQWIERGLNIKYMKFLLPRTVVLEEPDIEIELDEYRSYKRTKRSSKQSAK